ncbi:flagellar filament capping protein FliD [Novosphingobium sp.]|uniref:flagellar filament capping protein FliD n=1 Tax=Novosphingobium sp. TaxID=1874826 RepID=UPI002736C9B8|nr:flagellar filament capping protein FliD [Novosphingobium sp.]MDP3908404.1 flagellar filament capping protein FliD [Novosphingobium sp.]
MPSTTSATSSIIATLGAGSSVDFAALASAQTLTTPPLAAATSPTGSGTLTLRFGTVARAGFTADPAQAAVDITIASGATLADVAGAINGANAGVTAYVANGANGAQLVLKGKEGAVNGFVQEATETVGEEELAALAWTPAAAPKRLLASAGNAAYKLDGAAMTAASNTINEAAPGLNLKLTGTNAGSPTPIRFSEPTATVTTFMQDLTAALNELVGGLNDVVNPQTGDLARDYGARALRRSLSSLAGGIVMPGAAQGTPATLADLGLATNRDGTFRLDTARLNATLKASPDGVSAMFTTGLFGVYATLDKLARTTLATSDPGSLGGSITRYTARQTQVSADQTKLIESQEKLRAQLAQRFAGVDSRVGAFRSTLTFLQNQIDAWNASRN